MRNNIFKIFFIIFGLILFFPLATKAAVLYLDPASGQFGPGDTVIMKIKLDSQGECINAIDTGITFSDSLRLVDFSTGNSIINIWIDKPDSSDISKINLDKEFSFSGGIPGGYCGVIKGDQGESNILGEAIFEVSSLAKGQDGRGNSAQVSLFEGSVLLINDGKGTPAEVEIKNCELEMLPDKTTEANAWRERMEEDDIPPEPFVIELLNDERIYDGRYFIIFSTEDKQTGVDHYEVIEYGSEEELNGDQKSIIRNLFQTRSPQWRIAESPYLLEDQTLFSNIIVKAVDKAGNERSVKYFPEVSGKKKAETIFSNPINMLILLLSMIAAITLALLAVNRNKRKKNEKTAG